MKTNRNTRQCDICGKWIPKWNSQQLLKRDYKPGKNYEKVSSDIKCAVTKIVNLCPDCMIKLESLIRSKGYETRRSNNELE